MKNENSTVYKSLKGVVFDLDQRTILSGVELCLSGKHPCSGAGEYFKPDFVAIKKVMIDGKESVDVIIIDSKLSKTSPWTDNQKSELIDIFKKDTSKEFIEFEVRTNKSILEIKGAPDKMTKVRIYREDVYKIVSEGEGIKVPPIKQF